MPLWFLEGSAQYFMYIWLSHKGIDPGHKRASDRNAVANIVSVACQGTLRADTDFFTVYYLGFLAIDYLAEQRGDAKIVDFFIVPSRLDRLQGFEKVFESFFGISLDDFYDDFAAHRAAGFPDPGASFGAPNPAPTAANGRIVFSSNRDGNSEIYVMNVDGSNQTRLTNHPGYDGNPVWSPNGQRIAFTSGRGGNAEIYVMNADGTGVSRLTDATDVWNEPSLSPFTGDPAWSPDGQRIAFASNRESVSGSEVYVMNADGTNVSRLAPNYVSHWSSNPTWSPDGQRIAFASNTGDGGAEIYVMNSDGSNLTRLTHHHPWISLAPAWSPDGSRIAFISSLHGRDYGIYVMDTAALLHVGRALHRDHKHDNPAWSPDSQRIAFSSNRGGNSDIYIMDACGSNQTRLTNHPGGDFNPDWTSTAGGTVTPPGGGNIADRVAQLERQVSALQSEANAQQTRIDALDRLLTTLQAFIDTLAARVAALESGTPQPPPFVPTPSPTPTPTPAATTNNACIQNIELASLIAGTTITGTWTTDCRAANPPSSGRRYAKFYTFTLGNIEELEFRITSDARHYYSLLSGAGTDGRALHSGEVPPGEQMQLVLQPGSYTLEVTTMNSETTGDFDLWLGLRR